MKKTLKNKLKNNKIGWLVHITTDTLPFAVKGNTIMEGKVKVKVKSLSRVRLFTTPWTVAYQSPPSMRFSRQEYWSGLPFPSPGDLPKPGKRGVKYQEANILPLRTRN